MYFVCSLQIIFSWKINNCLFIYKVSFVFHIFCKMSTAICYKFKEIICFYSFWPQISHAKSQWLHFSLIKILKLPVYKQLYALCLIFGLTYVWFIASICECHIKGHFALVSQEVGPTSKFWQAFNEY